jgi:hypothetical protein
MGVKTKSKKLPALQFYPGDWRKDPGVQALDYFERGVWMELIFLMHESEQRGKLLLNGKPIPEERLAILLNLDKQKISNVITTFLELGVASLCEETGALMNRRMVRDEELIGKRRDAGKKGGNPALTKGKPNPYYTEVNHEDKQKITSRDKQKITPSFSFSSSDNTSEMTFTPEDMQVAKHIWQKILQLHPGHKEPKLEKWANTVRLMRERDGRAHSEITSLFDWANADNFWKSNILSPDKLRAQWDKLIIQRGIGQKASFHQKSWDNEAWRKEAFRLGLPEIPGESWDDLKQRVRQAQQQSKRGVA